MPLDFDILEEAGTTNQRLREFFTAKLPNERKLSKMEPKERKSLERDVVNRKKFEVKIGSWLSEHIVFSLTNHYMYSAVDAAWDSTPLQKTVLPLMMYAQGRIDISKAAKCLEEVPEGNKYVKRNTGGEAVSIDLPKFFEVNINLIRSVITRRLSAQSNKYNDLWPFFKYDSRTTDTVGKLRADAVSQRMDVMADQYDYRHFQTQVMRDMFLYGHSVAFPRADWEREVQWEKAPVDPNLKAKDAKIQKRARVMREGISWVNPHPTRVFYDNNFPLASLNTDTGCEYVGFWDVARWGDVADNPDYFNRDSVSFSADTAAWFTHFSIYFNQYFDRITPPSIPKDSTSPNDRKNNVGLYNGDLRESAAFFTHVFVKVNPREWGWGDYPYPIWVMLKVAGDATVVYARIMPSSPCAVFSLNENDGRLVNISMAHELMSFQDQLTNLFTQLLETIKADLFSVAVLNTDVFPDSEDGKKAMDEFKKTMQGHNFYTSTHVLLASFEKLQTVGINLTAENIFKIVRSTPNTAVDKIFASITQVISMAERLIVLSSQEQGQPAPREISATETNLISGSTSTVYDFISSAVDEGRAAMKRICYESFVAKGSDDVYLPVINRYPANIIQKAGFKPVQEENSDVPGGQFIYGITGSKTNLVHDFTFTSRDGAQRAMNTQSANVLVQMLSSLSGMPPEVLKAILAAMGKQKTFDMINEIFRLSGAGVDMNLEVKPGESDDLMIEDEQQVMQLIQRLSQAVQQNTTDVAQIKHLILGTASGGPGQQQQPQAPPQQQAPAGR